jgi:hypothetical protein
MATTSKWVKREPADGRDDFVSSELEINGYVAIADEDTFSPSCFHQICERHRFDD